MMVCTQKTAMKNRIIVTANGTQLFNSNLIDSAPQTQNLEIHGVYPTNRKN
jgi:hypothetical protein